MGSEPDPAAALEAIKDRAGVVAKLGPPRPGGDLINAAHRSAADVPRLLAALEAALKLADDWKTEATKAEDRAELASEGGDNTACAVLYARATALNQNARALREAITREITRKGGE